MEIYDVYQKWGETKLIGSRIITMEFDNKRFWKFTTALGRKLSDGRLFFTKLFLTVPYVLVSQEGAAGYIAPFVPTVDGAVWGAETNETSGKRSHSK